ncbi:MAG: UPF0146 family protein [Methanoregula sp.]|uniref:UPF0146 family protein n=1 Tax=Methanoregula sp. TaxID=2052170 RepID=UPI003BAFB8E2
MDGYKHIEHSCGAFIASHYKNPVEIGVGNNLDAARCIHEAGCPVRAIDIRECRLPSWLSFARDDIFSPDLSLYKGADVLYALRPAEEMIPALISLAQVLDCDLVVYHLGFESYGDGGSIVDCGVPLHYYNRRKSEPVQKSVD